MLDISPLLYIYPT